MLRLIIRPLLRELWPVMVPCSKPSPHFKCSQTQLFSLPYQFSSAACSSQPGLRKISIKVTTTTYISNDMCCHAVYFASRPRGRSQSANDFMFDTVANLCISQSCNNIAAMFIAAFQEPSHLLVMI